MLGDQEIGEVDEVGEARIEQQVPNNPKILFGKGNCLTHHIFFHK